MQAYELSKLISKKESRDKLNLEFLKVPDLSMGLAEGSSPRAELFTIAAHRG